MLRVRVISISLVNYLPIAGGLIGIGFAALVLRRTSVTGTTITITRAALTVTAGLALGTAIGVVAYILLSPQ